MIFGAGRSALTRIFLIRPGSESKVAVITMPGASALTCRDTGFSVAVFGAAAGPG